MGNKSKYIFILLFLLPLLVFSQVTVRAKIDSSAILIGQQTCIHVELSVNKGTAIKVPVFDKTLMQGVEIIKVSKPDTTEIDGGKIKIRTDYLVTSFDSGLYYIPPFKYVLGKDTFQSNQVGLKVVTLPVDTVKKQFYDIKTVFDPAFVFADYYFIILSVLLILFFITTGIYLYLRHKKNKPLFANQKKEPELPPHVKAMSELEHIKQEKLWQQGRDKDYHTRLTDVLRVYLHDRFGLNALEMTTDEILQVLGSIPEAQTVFFQLKEVMELSDFVKFAKWHPVPEENERSMMNALLFINSTKKEEINLEVEPKSDLKK